VQFVEVPEGGFPMGDADGAPSERPVHHVHLDAFAIALTPVTNADYARSPAVNPPGPPAGSRRVSRGGAWRHADPWSGVAHRSSLPPALRYSDYGFRLARDVR